MLLHNSCNLPRILYFNKICALAIKRTASSAPPPTTILLEKCFEEPIIVVPAKNKVDMIGPPDRISNLRPVVRQILLTETELERRLRELQDETQAWNHKFWEAHNSKFIRERNQYTKNHLKPHDERKTLTADEMSEFYKQFLDNNWRMHVRYNFEWYKRNVVLLFLAFRVSLQGIRN